MTMNNYQLIVLGAGPGGYRAALRAARHGMHTAVVENRETGGTCLNRGCVPTKALLHASHIYREALSAAETGIHADGLRVNPRELYDRKNRITATLSSGIEAQLKAAGVDLVRGTAFIPAPGTVEVTGADGVKTAYSCEHTLVATGSVPLKPPVPGLDLPGVMTSDTLLEGGDSLPSSIVIIGGGVIGVEFATFYLELGVRVAVVEGLDRLLPNLDRELGQNLAMLLKKQGAVIYTGAMVQSVEKSDPGLTVRFTCRSAPGEAQGETVLCAIGRRPYWDALFADDLQPEADGRRLKVDARFRTSLPGIYAIGDVSSKIQLAHVASAQGEAFADMLCGAESVTDLSVVPSCIYCHPEIASVGITEAEAKDAGIPVKVGKCVLGGNARTAIAGSGRAFIKLLADAETKELVGAQLMCENATDIVSQFSEAIANRMTPDALLHAMRPHPTYEEAVADALDDLYRKLAEHA